MTFKFTAPFKTLASSLAIAVALSSNAFAQGGSDPIPSIDIFIIKENSGSQLIKHGNYGEEEIGLTYNAGAEKLQDCLEDLIGQTMKINGFGDNWRVEARSSTIWNGLSKKIGDGDAGSTSFSYPAADRKGKMTITIRIHGDEDEVTKDVKGPRQDWAWEIARSRPRAENASSSVLNKDKSVRSKYIGETEKN